MHIGIYQMLLLFPDLKSKSLWNKSTPEQQKFSYKYFFLNKNKPRKKTLKILLTTFGK